MSRFCNACLLTLSFPATSARLTMSGRTSRSEVPFGRAERIPASGSDNHALGGTAFDINRNSKQTGVKPTAPDYRILETNRKHGIGQVHYIEFPSRQRKDQVEFKVRHHTGLSGQE